MRPRGGGLRAECTRIVATEEHAFEERFAMALAEHGLTPEAPQEHAFAAGRSRGSWIGASVRFARSGGLALNRGPDPSRSRNFVREAHKASATLPRMGCTLLA